MTATVDVDVYAKDRASHTFDTVGNAADRSGKHVHTFRNVLLGAFTGAAIISGARALVHVLEDVADRAIDDQKSTQMLALQLHNSADATHKQTAATEDWITAQGKALGIADDELRPALARAVTATHDVADAQDLVSEAMDVSAGKGKSLQTVIEALSKGEQGNTAGLGRLGVATKDAAGHALTFDQIQKNLAQTFKGQAAQAADTAAGKYQRVKVQFDELEEAIGYKVLPAITTFGQAILDDGVPAAEQLATAVGDKLGPKVKDLSHWFRENQDELEGLGHTALDTVIPAVETLATDAGKVLGWFMELPDPVKRWGAELGIVALVLPKVRAGIAGLGLSTLISDLSSAETRTRAFGTAAKGAAGVAGVAALIDSTQQGDKAIGALEETLGGAAVGGSMFGPWGAAAGAAIGGLHSAFKIMFSDVEQTGEVMTDGKKPVEDYASSFDDLTGAVTRATGQQIVQAAQQQGVLTQLREFGITQRQLVNATLGHKDAIAEVNAALNTSRGLVVNYTDMWGAHYSMSVRNEQQAKQLTASLKAQGMQIDDVASKNDDLASAKNILNFIGEQSREWRDQSKQVRDAILASQDLASVYKAFPKAVATQIDATGIVPTAKGVAELAIKYDAMDKRHVQALISATGTDLTVAQVQAVINKLNQVHDKHVTVSVSTITTPGGKEVPLPGGGGSRTGGKHGRTAVPDLDRLMKDSGIQEFSVQGFDPYIQNLGDAGAALMASLVKGIRDGHRPLEQVLNAVSDNLHSKIDDWQNLIDQRDQFATSFQNFAASIFTLHGTDDQPLTVADILAHSAQEKAKADQVDTDVQKLIGEGLSVDYIKQLQAQGADGVEALHVLAQASEDQIRQLNLDQIDIQKKYADAGMASANYVYSGLIQQAQAAVVQAQALQAAVDELKHLRKSLGEVKFILDGDQLVAVIDKTLQVQGKK